MTDQPPPTARLAGTAELYALRGVIAEIVEALRVVRGHHHGSLCAICEHRVDRALDAYGDWRGGKAPIRREGLSPAPAPTHSDTGRKPFRVDL